MGQINTTNLPDYAPEAQPANARTKTGEILNNAAPASETLASQDEFQLTRLSNVLNGLKRSAAMMRSQAAHVMSAVRSGTYQVDPLAVSRSIVGDCLAR